MISLGFLVLPIHSRIRSLPPFASRGQVVAYVRLLGRFLLRPEHRCHPSLQSTIVVFAKESQNVALLTLRTRNSPPAATGSQIDSPIQDLPIFGLPASMDSPSGRTFGAIQF